MNPFKIFLVLMLLSAQAMASIVFEELLGRTGHRFSIYDTMISGVGSGDDTAAVARSIFNILKPISGSSRAIMPEPYYLSGDSYITRFELVCYSDGGHYCEFHILPSESKDLGTHYLYTLNGEDATQVFMRDIAPNVGDIEVKLVPSGWPENQALVVLSISPSKNEISLRYDKRVVTPGFRSGP